MLYHWHEMQNQTAVPVRVAAEAALRLWRHPWVPLSYTSYGRAVAAGAELLARVTRRHGKPAWDLPTTPIDGVDVGVREVVVQERSFCRLIHFERAVERDDPRILVVAPVSGHYATLLRDTVRGLLPDHDVYVTDWIDARQVPLWRGNFGLDDYIDYVQQFLRYLGPDTHVMAVCQPSVPVLAAVSLMAAADDPCQPRSMTLMGGPIDTRENPTKVNLLAKNRPIDWFEKHAVQQVPMNFPGYNRLVYPGFLQLNGFMSMNLDRHVGAHMQLFEHLVRGDGSSADSHRKFYDEYLSVMDLTADFYLQTVERVFQDHVLPRGEMVADGRRVEPQAIVKTALMTVEGELDDISGVGQTKAAHKLCSNIPDERRRHHLQPKVGHYGIFNGRRWRTEILPQVREFIRAS